MREPEPSPRFRVSAESAGFEVVYFHIHLQVRNPKDLERRTERAEDDAGPNPPGGLRKDVILGELSCEIAQGCDSRGFTAGWADPGANSEVSRGLVGAITTHASMKC